jgi:hypothetical protein
MKKRVGRPSIPAHRRKIRIHLSIPPTLIEEIDEDIRATNWRLSRSKYIVGAIKDRLQAEEQIMRFDESSAEDCLVRLFGQGVISLDLMQSLRDKVRERPEFYTMAARHKRLKSEYRSKSDDHPVE